MEKGNRVDLLLPPSRDKNPIEFYYVGESLHGDFCILEYIEHTSWTNSPIIGVVRHPNRIVVDYGTRGECHE